MFDSSKFTTPKAKPLPVFLLLDVSGSMNEVVDPENVRRTGQTMVNDDQTWELVEDGTAKVQVLNKAVRNMIKSFAIEERIETEFLVSSIVFGHSATLHFPPTPVSSVDWTDMMADGCIAMGIAFSQAKGLIEDKEGVPCRTYRPTVVLVSDGQSTDDWKRSLESLINDGRSAKCFFMAMGIGEDPGMQVLERFISQTLVLAEVNGSAVPNTVFNTTDVHKIHEFFHMVSMSVTMRSKSQNLDAVIKSANDDQNNGGYW